MSQPEKRTVCMEPQYSHLALNQYCREISLYPPLTHEKEYELMRQYQEGNEAAGQQIIQRSLKFVVSVSRRYFYCGHHCLDIIQEGNLGLIKALKRFDPERGVPFTSYAAWWIRAFIMNFMYRSGKVSTGTLSHAKNLFSLDEHHGDDDTEGNRLIDYLTDGSDPEKLFHGKQTSEINSSLLDHCFTSLTTREVFILKKRFFSDPPVTLKEISRQLGISRERVRQIQMKSMIKLKKILENRSDTSCECNHFDSGQFPEYRQSVFIRRGDYQN